MLIDLDRPSEHAAAIADADGVTDPERMITEQVARGRSTSKIADHVHLAAYTV